MKRYDFAKAIRTMLLTLVITSLATSVVAQDPVLDVQAIPAQPVQAFGIAVGNEMPSEEILGGAKQFQMMRLYAMEIRRVEAAAELESAQKTKLTIGAKGLAKKKSQEFVKNTLGMAGGMAMPSGGAAQPTNDETEVKFVEVKSFDDMDANTRAMLDSGMFPEAKPYDDAEWLKLVKAVLKPEQFSKYEQVIAENKLKTDRAMVEAGMAKLTESLALNDDQKNKLTTAILEQMAKVKHVPGLADQVMMAMQIEGQQLTLELARMDPSKLRSILTPQQFEQVSLKMEIIRNVVHQLNPDIQLDPAEQKQ